MAKIEKRFLSFGLVLALMVALSIMYNNLRKLKTA